jgi:hypothetical protein
MLGGVDSVIQKLVDAITGLSAFSAIRLSNSTTEWLLASRPGHDPAEGRQPVRSMRSRRNRRLKAWRYGALFSPWVRPPLQVAGRSNEATATLRDPEEPGRLSRQTAN